MADNVNFPGQPAPKRSIVEDAFKILASAYGGHVEAQTKLLEQGLKDGRFKPSLSGGIEEVPLDEQPEWMKAQASLNQSKAYEAMGKPELIEAQKNKLDAETFAIMAGIGTTAGATTSVGAATPQQREAAKAYILSNPDVKNSIKTMDPNYKSPFAGWKVKLRQRYGMTEQEIRAIEEQL